MTKKMYDKKLRATVEDQDKALEDRFDKADSVLLRPPVAVPKISPRKSAVTRDTFSMPPDDWALIDALRTAAAMRGRISSKSEIVRAGLHALGMLEGLNLVEALNRLTKVKPGRKT